MKWKNKGHELDDIYQNVINRFEKYKKIYIFGAGINAYSLLYTLEHYGWMSGLIDNDIEKQKHPFHGYKLYSLSEYLGIKQDDCLIIIAATPKNTEMISKQLESNGLDHEEDYITENEFVNRLLPIYSLYALNEVYINLSQICLTERCTLKCKDCAHGCYAVSIRSEDTMTPSRMKDTVDAFFKQIDFISEFVLIGGEPLLYKDLAMAIEYVGSNYSNKIGVLSITTNGTIIPDEKILNVSHKYNVLYRISNYINAIPKLQSQYQKLTEKLGEYDIPYILGKADEEWFDYGFGHYIDRSDESELIKKFDRCNTPCREIRDSRLYFCVMARTSSDNLEMNAGNDDYLDLSEINNDLNGKKILTEFNLGYSYKGYIDMCRFCHGADSYKYVVKAAEQVG